MRTRKDIENDGRKKDTLILEVMLDIRELLKKGRPKGKKKALAVKSKPSEDTAFIS